ncbi:hypothetical protein BJ878DRAFT_513239 [Calycina marina]|uniref:Transmembrane protein n=1 Tax=Calycina marina TaxID=1763456 RepID=A0A9P7YZX3_9HELO|nr:hypothetical protein BJ878DRAFT_513239 [Calycina marina]
MMTGHNGPYKSLFISFFFISLLYATLRKSFSPCDTNKKRKRKFGWRKRVDGEGVREGGPTASWQQTYSFANDYHLEAAELYKGGRRVTSFYILVD